MGAPKKNNDKLAREVVSLIELEAIPLNEACLKVGIPRGSFYLQLNNDEELVDMYARAREIRADIIFEEILKIADAQSEDIVIDSFTGEQQVNHNVIQRNRLQIDARKWVLGKMSAKYADNSKIDLTTNGKEINASPAVINISIVPPIEDNDE